MTAPPERRTMPKTGGFSARVGCAEAWSAPCALLDPKTLKTKTYSMMVFLRNVPPDVTLAEIMDFLDPAVRGGIFRRGGEVVSVNLLEVKVFRPPATEYHAIAHIKPDAVALRVIKTLHAQMFRGRRIALHEYTVRNWRNDRRTPPPDKTKAQRERRLLATRRRRLTIEVKPLD
jgi:hypothetical protein